jgi:hypothetical protein
LRDPLTCNDVGRFSQNAKARYCERSEAIQRATKRGAAAPLATTRRICSLPRRRSRSTMSNQLIVQVVPFAIELFNQSQFRVATAGLDLLFAGNSVDHAFVKFAPDQNLTAVFLRKPWNQSFAVFERASRQIAGHAGIERPVSRTCHDVDAGLFDAASHWLSAVTPSLRRALVTKQSRLRSVALDCFASLAMTVRGR